MNCIPVLKDQQEIQLHLQRIGNHGVQLLPRRLGLDRDVSDVREAAGGADGGPAGVQSRGQLRLPHHHHLHPPTLLARGDVPS